MFKRQDAVNDIKPLKVEGVPSFVTSKIRHSTEKGDRGRKENIWK
jgi:hypothetical protein